MKPLWLSDVNCTGLTITLKTEEPTRPAADGDKKGSSSNKASRYTDAQHSLVAVALLRCCRSVSRPQLTASRLRVCAVCAAARPPSLLTVQTASPAKRARTR